MATKIRGTGWSAMLIRSITLRAPPPPSTDQPPVVPFLSQGGRGWTGWLGRRDSNLCILESEFAKTLSPGGGTRTCASRIKGAPDRRLKPVEAG
jgi:hypothetical protein